MRAIDADALKITLDVFASLVGFRRLYDRGQVMECIDAAPTIATGTNVLGKWIKLTGMAPPEHHGHKICSVCNCLAPYDPIHQWREVLSPYCPGCGAKMEVQNADD